METNETVTEKMVDFINSIGIPCKPKQLGDDTFLPGIQITSGCIFYDPEKMKYPGDLLHEAGHLAMLLPEDRAATGTPDKINGDLEAGGAEMGAIIWSWAAVKHIGLEPNVVFHEHGYRGGADNLINNFNEGQYFGHELLQWMGMTTAVVRGDDTAEFMFPKMKNWLRQKSGI
jgi:hypothetical protein